MKQIFSLMLLLVASLTYAQPLCTISLSGSVVDEHDATALSFADVWIFPSGKHTVANDQGYFSFQGLCPEEAVLQVVHVGCDSQRITLELKRDTQVVAYLEHHHELLEMVRIEGIRPHLDIHARQEVSLERIQQMNSLNFSDMLNDELGVQSFSSGGNISKPMLHGLSGNRVALSDNGVVLEGQQWGVEHAPEIDPYAVEEVEIIYGASSLRYGPEALAGAVIAKQLSDTNRALNGWVHITGSSNGRGGAGSVLLRGALHKELPLFAYVQGTLGKTGDLQAPSYVLDNTGAENAHGQLGMSWIGERFGVDVKYRRFNTRLGILSYAHIGNLTDLSRAIEQEQPANISSSADYQIDRPFQQVQHEVTSGELWWKPRLETKLSLSVNRQFNHRKEFDNSTFSTEAADLEYELTTHSGKLELAHRFGTWLKSEFGVVAQRQANTYTGRFFIPNFLAYEAGIFAIQHLTIDRHEVEFGARIDQREQQAFMYRMDTIYSPERSFGGVSWNVGYAFNNGALVFSSNVAQGWRPPAINELYSNGLHHGAASIEVGDELLNEERAWSWMNQLDINAFYWLGTRWDLMLRGYVSYFDQFIYLVPTGEPQLTIRGAFPTFNYMGVDALLGGIDGSLSARFLKKWEGRLGVELVRAQDRTSKKPLIFIPPDRADIALRFNLDQYYGRRFLEVSASGVREQQLFPAGVDYTPPPEGYALINAEFGWQFEFSKNFRLISTVGVNNLLNTRYRSYTNRLRYFADEMGRNISVTLRIPFNLNKKQISNQLIQTT